MLLLDALNSPFKDQAYARSQMLKYVIEQSQPGQPMAVVGLTDRLHVLQQFTSDPQTLLTAIKNFQPQEQILQASARPAESAVPTDMVRGSEAALSAIEVQQQVASFSNLVVGYDLERLITIEAMRSLTRMLGGLQGRKTVVWLTADLPFDLIPENRNITDAELAADLPDVANARGHVIVKGAGAVAAEERELHAQEIKDAESRLASVDIVIYPVDVRGLVGGMESLAAVSEAHSRDIHGAGLANQAIRQSQSLEPSQDTMREIAGETGGKAYMNENEIRQGVALAVSDNKASYEIGYYPENKKWDGKYRKISIKVAQGDTQIRHRKGYFAIDPMQNKDVNYEPDVASALAVGAPATQISFMAQAKPTAPGKMRVVFLVDANTLTAEDAGGGKKMTVSMYASVYDANGKSLETRSTKVDRTFDAGTYKQILDRGMMVPIDMDRPAVAQQLRLAVLDGKTGFIGTASGPIGQ